MKTKIFLTTCALAVAVVGCQNDDFGTIGTGEQASAGLVEVGDNFMIVGVGEEPTATRTHWVLNGDKLSNVFTPIVAETGKGNTTIGSTEVLAPTIGACALVGGSVHSNYEFYHYGWLGKGQTEANFDPCTPGELANGWLYSDLSYKTSAPSAGEDAAVKYADGKMEWLLTGDNKTVGTATLKSDEMNANSGIYKTENKAMFEGDYILYYPYDETFSSGLIPARSKVAFEDMTQNNVSDPQVAENTFRYAYAPGLVGGTQASAFEFTSLSGIIKISIGGTYTKKISKVMLYSPSGAFKKTVYLNPTSIVGGSTGTSVYAGGEEETSKTIVISMATSQELEAPANAQAPDDAVYVAALPANIPDLELLAQNEDGKWAQSVIGAKEIKPNTGIAVAADFSDDDFKDVYLAVDAATLDEAIKKCNDASLSATETAAIQVIGEITLADMADVTIPSYVTVKGDRIIVPETATLKIDQYAAVASDIDVEGESCCSGSGQSGQLIVYGAGEIDGNVNIMAGEGKDKKAATLYFSASKTGTSKIGADAVVTVDGEATFKGVTDVLGTLDVNENAKVTIGAEDAKGPNVNVNGGIVNNKGTFEVLYGNFAVSAAPGQPTTNAIGKNFKNEGTFIDNVGTVIGGIVANYMDMGEDAKYICRVNSQARLEEAYENKLACNVIDFIAENKENQSYGHYDIAVAKQHNGKDLDIIVSGEDVIFDPKTPVKVGNVEVTGKLIIATTIESKNVMAAIAVNGDIDVEGTFEVSSDVMGMEAENLTVYAGGTATFKKRVARTGVTLNVDQNIVVKENGTLTIEGGAEGDVNAASVTCGSYNGIMNGYPTIR